MKRPSTNCPYQGEIRSPPSPSPGPSILKSAAKWKFELLLNSAAVVPPSDEKLKLCRLAKPTHSVSMTSVIAIDAGSLLVLDTVEIGQSLKVRRAMNAPFTVGVACAIGAPTKTRHADHARWMIPIRFMVEALLADGGAAGCGTMCESRKLRRRGGTRAHHGAAAS